MPFALHMSAFDPKRTFARGTSNAWPLVVLTRTIAFSERSTVLTVFGC